nr:L-threonylcarbamoyladenylate synthase [Planosporangium mesophilum]
MSIGRAVTKFEYASATPGKLLTFGEAARIADILRRGGLAVLPTETGYMIAAAATDTAAVSKVFHAKQRSLSNPMHVAVASLAMAQQFAEISPLAARLMGEFTPGPLTIVVPQSGRLPTSLVTLNGTVGIRVPDHPATLQVVALLGEPVTATSLNRSGEESLPLDRTQLESLEWPDDEIVPVLEDKTSITQSSASTLARITAGDVEILRVGPVSEAAVRRAVENEQIA